MVDEHRVDDIRCPDCGSLVTSLDEPCANCASWGDASGDAAVLPYEFSKTFTLRFAPLRPYRPEPFVAGINEWLDHERGLLDVPSMVIQRNQGLVTDVTLSCFGINSPTNRRFQIERVVLVKGQFRRKGTKLGEALNSWREQNPGRKLLRFVPLGAAGVTYEVWVLSVAVTPAATPAEDALLH